MFNIIDLTEKVRTNILKKNVNILNMNPTFINLMFALLYLSF